MCFFINSVIYMRVRGFNREHIVVRHVACSLFGEASEFEVQIPVRLYKDFIYIGLNNHFP